MTLREKVQERREDILRLADKYGATNVRVFGSVARGDDTPESDLDLLVEFHRSLLKLIGFEQDLEKLLGCRVDVVSEGGISPYIESEILQSAIPL